MKIMAFICTIVCIIMCILMIIQNFYWKILANKKITRKMEYYCDKAYKNNNLCEGYFDDNDDTLEICKNCIKCISGYYQNNEIPYEIKKE